MGNRAAHLGDEAPGGPLLLVDDLFRRDRCLGASASAGGRSSCDGSLAAAGAGAALDGSLPTSPSPWRALSRRASPVLRGLLGGGLRRLLRGGLVPFSLRSGSLIAARAASASAASFSFSFASISFSFSAASALSASISSNSGFVLGEHRLGLKPAALNLCETLPPRRGSQSRSPACGSPSSWSSSTRARSARRRR